MRKMRYLRWSLLTSLGTTVGALALYAATHPVVAALAILTPMRVSDRDAKTNLQPVQSKELLLQVATLPTFWRKR